MLHGVVDPALPADWKPLRPQTTPEHLSKVLAVLSQYYRFVSLTEAMEMLTGIRPLQPNSLVLTFDDGYRNNITCALPILRQYSAPATIYLSTGNVTEQQPFWFDRLDYAVQAVSNDIVFRNAIPEFAEIDFSTRETLQRSFIFFIRKEKQRYPTDIAMHAAVSNLIERLEQRSGHGLAERFADDPWSGILTWEEVRQAAPEVYFGSHGVNHLQLSLLPLDIAAREMIESREAIEFNTDRPCAHLAYPNGAYNKQVIIKAKEALYSTAVTAIGGHNSKLDDLFALKRIAFPRTNSPAGIVAASLGLVNLWANY